MKVMQINIFGNLSTGRIAVDIYRTLKSQGHDGLVAFSRNTIDEDVSHFQFGSRWSVYSDVIMTRLTDKAGYYSKGPTKKLIEKIKEYDPDIIHLHNIHGYYINIEILFDYLKKSEKPVVWTLHDCWPFTGHCCYYSMAECRKWEVGCCNCPQLRAYPKSLFIDNSANNYYSKRNLFTSVPNLHLVCVSNWLRNEVKKSFLKDIPCEVIYNGIDLNVFKPTESNFKREYGIEDKKVILGVASTWDVRKGLNDFIELSRIIDEKYKIVLVGLNDKEKKMVPNNILGLSRTNSVRELVDIYTAADVFFNASVEETFGLPTVEAMSCGTPVIVYNSTALPEVCTNNTGAIVEQHDVNKVYSEIKKIVYEPFKSEEIIKRACEFDAKKSYSKYLALYMKLIV